ncbi:glycoside hydrolase family 5 protein [Polychaeton citri CBS 116435]|uniref:glucan 1,3-beta-glucosidase n=1 Tax=Polychaeton citri CBS 116435 TaxID=1314669 RepID=A0A9P4UNP8_9PEZI|nr:glycoside hydrolase family 5 protein [Polychaeton citri CBS 116435]
MKGFRTLSSTAAAAAAAMLLATTTNAAPTGMMSMIRRDDQLKFNFGGEKIRGVNLGGWLVLEPWITPSIFEATPDNVVDEYTFGQTLGREEASKRLQEHWSTWITEGDFGDIASKGLNFVRIPIGYWSITPLDGDPYVQGAYEYLGKALDWAQGAGLKVMVDIHGAPGSQNGFDNSGRRGDVEWTQGDSVSQTLKAIDKLRDDHASHPALASIELLNEPLGPALNMDTVRQFMMDGWGNLKNSHVAVAFHDAFEGVTSWNDWGSGMWALLLDTHHYEIFDSGALQMGIDDHVGTACGFGEQMSSNNKWTISGEWTGAFTDCAKWLNGRGVGARYDGTYNWNGQGSSYIGSCDGKFSGRVEDLSDTDKSNIGKFINAQMVAFEKADGWIFWTWKNEGAPEWHFRDLANAGIIPQPLSSMNYGICG